MWRGRWREAQGGGSGKKEDVNDGVVRQIEIKSEGAPALGTAGSGIYFMLLACSYLDKVARTARRGTGVRAGDPRCGGRGNEVGTARGGAARRGGGDDRVGRSLERRRGAAVLGVARHRVLDHLARVGSGTSGLKGAGSNVRGSLAWESVAMSVAWKVA